LEAWYRRFAEEEARGRPPLYEALAAGIAGDPDVITFLLALPAEKRQPNLLLAAVRHLFGTPKDWEQFRRTLLANTDAVRAFMLIHATQTNEPWRTAAIMLSATPIAAILFSFRLKKGFPLASIRLHCGL
jgi:Uncharacterized protein conserved in bacteria (DUF2332)